MTARHTPGPWDFSGPHGRTVQNKCANYIARTMGDNSDAQHEANAHLIAAAPDMLAALVALLDWGREHTSPTDANSPHALLIDAAAAALKAMGGSVDFGAIAAANEDKT